MNKEYFELQGLASEKTLSGSVPINGAKNAALKAMAASILFDGPVKLQNIPATDDIDTLSKILTKMGAKVEKTADHQFEIDTSNIISTDIDLELAKTMRASVVLTGPILSRFGKLTFPAPGGCVIGSRPIDLFLKGYEKMGATTSEDEFLYTIEGDIKGAEIFFEKISVGATETLMMAAILAKGKTVLKNCAREPEIVNVAEWLNSAGAKIKGAGTPTMEIDGSGGKLLRQTSPYAAIPDRIEAGSYLILGALCAKDLEITNCDPSHLESVISLLQESGVPITVSKDSVRIKNNIKPNHEFKSFNLRTQEYPGFPTDLQAPMTVYLTQTSGESLIVETIFEGRLKYVEDLVKMNAQITTMNPREILVKGHSPLQALPDKEILNAHDIRAGFAITLAALCGKGDFIISNIHLIDRGYEKLEERLSNLGAKIKRIE